ncbi:MAG: sulfatase-like hydrolase/transferase [Deltaproteobacteria bacterium]|jgi:arylsulfatase A-like enzyme/membrane-associated phospholipid phosphatase|nr:sulfatase-like hydrolase/transferase [Deltaproteobacteria bacterium]
MTRFLRDWWPVVAVLAVYESLKHMHANRITEWLGIAPKDELMLRIDEWLFFGKTLPLYMDTWTAPWFISLMTFCYIWVYYAGPVVLMGYAYFFTEGDSGFRRLRLGLILGLLGGYVIYLLVPVAGPLFLVGDQFEHPIPSQPKLANLVFDTLRYNWDCFPSLHTAIPWILTALAWRSSARWVRALAVLLSAGVTLSTVALRFHYGIDLIAGIAWAALVYFAVDRLERHDYGTFHLPRLPFPEAVYRVGLSQWPAIAGGWAIYGLGLVAIGLSILIATPILLGQKLGVLFFLLFVLAAEVGAMVLLNGVLEVAGSPLGRPRWLDALRGIALAALALVPITSLLKFALTGVHLKASDLRFVLGSSRQVSQESQGLEIGLVAALATLFALIAVGGGIAFHRLRHRGLEVDVPRLILLVLLMGVGAGYTYSAYPVVRSFAGHVVPEFHWLQGGAELSGASGPVAAPRGSPISEWRPEVDSTRPNVLLVMLESIPWQRTWLGGGRHGVAPNLERLASESVVFSRAYTTSTHSDYAQMAILSSLHPRKYQHHDFYDRIDYPRALLWDALFPAGYRTSLFSTQNEGWGNMIAFLDTPGLEHPRHSPDWPEAPKKGRGKESKVHEETAVQAWMEWLEETDDGPWLTYLNFQSNHFPYEIPDDASRPFEPHLIDFPLSFFSYPRERVDLMLNRFDNALAYADLWIGEIRAFLERRGEWENTAVIVVSDHGEAFYEHDEPTHGSALYEEQVRSFLLLRIPGEESRRIDQPVSLLDVAPTLLASLGLPRHGNFQGRDDILSPTYSAAGRPLLFTIQGITREDGVLLDGWKYTVNWDRRHRSLYDLSSDPAERVNLLADNPERTREMHAALMTLLRQQVAYYENKGWEQGVYPARLP